jgi:hypothetical protein
MDATTEGYSIPTMGGFWKSFACQSPSSFGKKELENGGKIILPASSLEDLTFAQEEMDTSTPFSSFGGSSYGGLRRSMGPGVRAFLSQRIRVILDNRHSND